MVDLRSRSPLISAIRLIQKSQRWCLTLQALTLQENASKMVPNASKKKLQEKGLIASEATVWLSPQFHVNPQFMPAACTLCCAVATRPIGTGRTYLLAAPRAYKCHERTYAGAPAPTYESHVRVYVCHVCVYTLCARARRHSLNFPRKKKVYEVNNFLKNLTL